MRQIRRARPRSTGEVGDRVLLAVTAMAALIAVLVLAEIGYQVITGARPAISRFGLGFLCHSGWHPNFSISAPATMLYGTIVSSLIALSLAMPLGIAIALYLSMMAPRGVRAVVGPLVEMLAAIPSVVLGFWGVIVLAPFVQQHVEPWLNHSSWASCRSSGPRRPPGLSMFTAGLVLTIMVLPIIASLSRDMFLTVPRELRDGAEALGATRWEMIRGVVLPTTISGVAAATVLGLGRALGEAIAVTQVIGDGSADPFLAVRDRDHARQQDRPRLPIHGLAPAHRLAVLPRADPARDRDPHQSDRPGDRPPVRRAPLARPMSTLSDPTRPQPITSLKPSGNLRRRAAVSRLLVGGPRRRRWSPSPSWRSLSSAWSAAECQRVEPSGS